MTTHMQQDTKEGQRKEQAEETKCSKETKDRSTDFLRRCLLLQSCSVETSSFSSSYSPSLVASSPPLPLVFFRSFFLSFLPFLPLSAFDFHIDMLAQMSRTLYQKNRQ